MRVHFMMPSSKIFVPVVALSINDNIKFLENINQGFNWTISWYKHRSAIAAKPKNSNLDYMIDLTFRNIIRLFVPSFKNGDNNPTRNSFLKYYISLVEIKDFDALLTKKHFFGEAVKKKQKNEKLFEMSRNDNCTGNYFSKS